MVVAGAAIVVVTSWAFDAGWAAVHSSAVHRTSVASVAVAVAPGVRRWAGPCPFAVGAHADSAACRCGGQGLLLSTSVATVKFVRVGEVGNVFFAHGLWIFFEIGMVNGVDGVEAAAPVELHQICEKRQACV